MTMDPGDAVVYRGMELPHWREPLDGDRAHIIIKYSCIMSDVMGILYNMHLTVRLKLPK